MLGEIVPTLPDFEATARELLMELCREPVSPTNDHALVMVTARLRHMWEDENVAAESIATSCGDRYEKQGDTQRAEAAWAVAARIAMRRPPTFP